MYSHEKRRFGLEVQNVFFQSVKELDKRCYRSETTILYFINTTLADGSEVNGIWLNTLSAELFYNLENGINLMQSYLVHCRCISSFHAFSQTASINKSLFMINLLFRILKTFYIHKNSENDSCSSQNNRHFLSKLRQYLVF